MFDGRTAKTVARRFNKQCALIKIVPETGYYSPVCTSVFAGIDDGRMPGGMEFRSTGYSKMITFNDQKKCI